MKTTHISQPAFSAWRPGDPMLERIRTELSPPAEAPLQNFYGGGSSEDVGLIDIPKPEKDDFKGLSKTLQFLKFTASEQEVLFNVIGSTINIAAGIVSIVGAVGAAIDLMNKLGILSPAEDPVQAALKQIGQRVEQIYGYLAAQERRGLYNQALLWRVNGDNARNAVMNAKTSRSPENLLQLANRASELNQSILQMLGAGRIAFLRSVYGYPWWVPYAQTPYMKTAGGAPINYRDPGQELQAEIWDPGHYLDVLVRSVQDRIAVAMTLEPAFRSTGYDRAVLRQIADGLLAFAHTWRASILVADPVFALNAGGTMRSPELGAPPGVPIGAVDPVTGVSSFEPQWSGFSVEFKRSYFPGEAWGGVWDESRATDPAAALAAITAVHTAAVDSVVRACGVDKMLRLSQRVRELASSPQGSDFVRLPDAKFRRPLLGLEGWGMVNGNSAGEGTPVVVDLGRLRLFSPAPERTYAGMRFRLRGTKEFSFSMPRRADQSGIRLGYRLRVGGAEIGLMTFATAADRSGGDFPSGAIETDCEVETRVYDCVQSAHVSAAGEDQFERNGRIAGTERLFLNERVGKAKFRVEVGFVPFKGGDPSAYAGTVKVAISALEPDSFPDAAILGVMVLETRVGDDFAPEEVVADSMTVHLVPTYVVLGADFFADYRAAVAQMAKTVKELDRKSIPQREIPTGPPDPDPAWQVRARAIEVERGLDRVQDSLAQQNILAHEIVAANIVPVEMGRGELPGPR
ncbi:hypothetical protein [Pseudoduganella umbonata]|uniref:Uncharacterized protein n=1 Tax=Pseudoduganella umbonata TaxID=864828 RepID=A0A4P8HI04_9BURK|nr:hypothetical protein [Pseudoduganella umbonata]MBB3224977.1 hypothetical protein [Pseudoduganella umbonata]QCP09249.1 hypothetical protein FCL38_01445 [Pseudoduganella umbonata]